MRAAWRVAEWVAFALALLCGSTIARADAPVDEEVLLALERWQEEPLDLSSATAAELTLFPWLDLAAAERIVGLREAGELRALDDLLLVPGIDAEVVAALIPFVRLEPRLGRIDGSARLEARARQGASPASMASVRTELAQGSWLEAATRSAAVAPTARRWRASAGGPLRGIQWVAGPLRARLGLGLLEGDPAGRSRTGPVSVGRPFGFQPHRSLSSGARWEGLGLSAQGRGTRWLLGLGRGTLDDAPRVLAAIERAPRGPLGAGVGVALLRRAASQDLALWGDWEMPAARARLELARPADGASRGAAVLRVRGDRWRLGAGVGADASGGGDGVDPIAGSALDRPHSVLQLDGVRRLSDGWSLEALWRRVERGAAGDQTLRERAQLAAQGTASGGSWRSWIRIDRAIDPVAPGTDEEAPHVQLGLRWRDDRPAAGLRRELSARREWTSTGGRALLVGADVAGALGASHGLQWRVGASVAAGNRSSLSVVGVPGLGVDSAWIEAGGVRLLAAAATTGGKVRLAAAAACQAGAGQHTQLQLQLRLEIKTGD